MVVYPRYFTLGEEVAALGAAEPVVGKTHGCSKSKGDGKPDQTSC